MIISWLFLVKNTLKLICFYLPFKFSWLLENFKLHMWLALPYCSTLHSGGHHSSSLSTHWQSSLSHLVDFSICHQHESVYYWLGGGSGCRILISAPHPGPSISLQLQCWAVCIMWAKSTSRNWHRGWKHKEAKARRALPQNLKAFKQLLSSKLRFFPWLYSEHFRTDVKRDTVNIFWDYF